MKRLELSEDERHTLRDMGIFHPRPRTLGAMPMLNIGM
jgi:hypothetical protein